VLSNLPEPNVTGVEFAIPPDVIITDPVTDKEYISHVIVTEALVDIILNILFPPMVSGGGNGTILSLTV
jgi:hypothetical protein